jgi:hypothetical protein
VGAEKRNLNSSRATFYMSLLTNRNIVIGRVLSEAVHVESLLDHISTVV